MLIKDHWQNKEISFGSLLLCQCLVYSFIGLTWGGPPTQSAYSPSSPGVWPCVQLPECPTAYSQDGFMAPCQSHRLLTKIKASFTFLCWWQALKPPLSSSSSCLQQWLWSRGHPPPACHAHSSCRCEACGPQACRYRLRGYAKAFPASPSWNSPCPPSEHLHTFQVLI